MCSRHCYIFERQSRDVHLHAPSGSRPVRYEKSFQKRTWKEGGTSRRRRASAAFHFWGNVNFLFYFSSKRIKSNSKICTWKKKKKLKFLQFLLLPLSLGSSSINAKTVPFSLFSKCIRLYAIRNDLIIVISHQWWLPITPPTPPENYTVQQNGGSWWSRISTRPLQSRYFFTPFPNQPRKRKATLFFFFFLSRFFPKDNTSPLLFYYFFPFF